MTLDTDKNQQMKNEVIPQYTGYYPPIPNQQYPPLYVGQNNNYTPNLNTNQFMYTQNPPVYPYQGYNYNPNQVYGYNQNQIYPNTNQQYNFNQNQGFGAFNSNQGYGFNQNQMEYDFTVFSADTDISIRHAFLRKVFVILAICICVSFGFALIVNLFPVFSEIIKNNYLLFTILGLVLYIVPLLALMCSQKLAQSFPMNYILLALLVIGVSIILGMAGAVTSSAAFLIAFGITFFVVAALMLFAFQTKYDFTGWGPYLLVFFIVFMIFCIVAIFVRSPIFHTILASFGALLMGFMIVYDTQTIVGGKHRKYQIGVDQYIMAVITLYLDIVMMFLYILELVQACLGEH